MKKNQIEVFRKNQNSLLILSHVIELSIPFHSSYEWIFKLKGIFSPRKIKSVFSIRCDESICQIWIINPRYYKNIDISNITYNSEEFIKMTDLHAYLNFVKPKKLYNLPKIEVSLS